MPLWGGRFRSLTLFFAITSSSSSGTPSTTRQPLPQDGISTISRYVDTILCCAVMLILSRCCSG